jgi:cytochrome c peroxidase
MGPLLNPAEMGLTAEDIERKTGRSAADVAGALASYVRTIRSRESRYDWYAAGQPEMLTELERTGLGVFRARGCGSCHAGSRFTDDRFHNTGVGWSNGQYADEGRFAISSDERDRGAFKTPTLRDIALTAPYMHDGSVATLEEVVEFYGQGGRRNPALDSRIRPGRFSPAGREALVAFLKALTGRIVEGF